MKTHKIFVIYFGNLNYVVLKVCNLIPNPLHPSRRLMRCAKGGGVSEGVSDKKCRRIHFTMHLKISSQ